MSGYRNGGRKDSIYQSRVGMLVAGIAVIVLGLVCFMNPTGSMATVVLVFGWLLVVSGIVSIVSAITRRTFLFAQIDLYVGLIELLFGVLMIREPMLFVTFAFIIMGIAIVTLGVNLMTASSATGMLTGLNTSRAFVTAIAMVALGILVMLAPMAASDMAMMVAGVALILSGIEATVDGAKLLKSEKKKN